jgi:hypothetical protein
MRSAWLGSVMDQATQPLWYGIFRFCRFLVMPNTLESQEFIGFSNWKTARINDKRDWFFVFIEAFLWYTE